MKKVLVSFAVAVLLGLTHAGDATTQTEDIPDVTGLVGKLSQPKHLNCKR